MTTHFAQYSGFIPVRWHLSHVHRSSFTPDGRAEALEARFNWSDTQVPVTVADVAESPVVLGYAGTHLLTVQSVSSGGGGNDDDDDGDASMSTQTPVQTDTQTPTPTDTPTSTSSSSSDGTSSDDQRQPSGETSEGEEWGKPSDISEVEVVDVRLETAPTNSVNTTSIVTLDNPSVANQTVDARFIINDEVVEQRAVVAPAGERMNATHSEIVEGAGTHEVAANLATKENGETVRTFKFTIGTVELDQSGEEVASSSAEPPSVPGQVDTTEGQQSDERGANLPVVLLGLVALVAAIPGTLYWQRQSG